MHHIPPLSSQNAMQCPFGGKKSALPDANPHHVRATAFAISRPSLPSSPSPPTPPPLLFLLLSRFSAFFLSFSAVLSSAVGTGSLSSIGVPNGAIMLDTTWCTCFDARQPGWMEMMSPARSESRGSCTRRCVVRLYFWNEGKELV